MGSNKGWFESEDEYRNRLEKESNERIIEQSTGETPEKGWFESDEDYLSRISQEANERTIEGNTGVAASQGWFESKEEYRSRVEQEANISTVSKFSDEQPKQGWLEEDQSFNTRMRQEANEAYLTDNGTIVRQGWFEGDFAYRQRINQEANKITAYSQKAAESGSAPQVLNVYHSSETTTSSEKNSSRTSIWPFALFYVWMSLRVYNDYLMVAQHDLLWVVLAILIFPGFVVGAFFGYFLYSIGVSPSIIVAIFGGSV